MAIDPRRIPFIGHDIYQAGQVYDITAQACSPDPWIAVQAAWSYTPMLLWSLVKPDYGDLTFNRGGFRHSRKRKREFRLNGSMLAPAPTKPGVAFALFRGHQILERLGWWFIVADAATDFAYNWTSMAYAWSGCHVAGSPSAKISGAYGFRGGGDQPATMPWTGTTFEAAHPGSASEVGVAIGTNGPKSMSVQITTRMEPAFGQTGTVTSATIVRATANRPVHRISLSPSGDPSGTAVWSGSDRLLDPDAPATQWRVLITIDRGNLYLDGGRMTAEGAPAWSLEHDP